MNEKPEVWMIVLAAGFSRRMGEQKLLLPIGNETLVRRAVKTALTEGVSGVVVVLNPAYESMRDEIKDLPVSIKWNEAPDQGMSASIRTGIQSLPSSTDAAGVLLADEPGVTKQVINQVLKDYVHTREKIIQVAYQNIPGHPVIFDKLYFSELTQISGDQGGRDIIKNNKEKRRLVHVSMQSPDDIDTKEDYERMISKGV